MFMDLFDVLTNSPYLCLLHSLDQLLYSIQCIVNILKPHHGIMALCPLASMLNPSKHYDGTHLINMTKRLRYLPNQQCQSMSVTHCQGLQYTVSRCSISHCGFTPAACYSFLKYILGILPLLWRDSVERQDVSGRTEEWGTQSWPPVEYLPAYHTETGASCTTVPPNRMWFHRNPASIHEHLCSRHGCKSLTFKLSYSCIVCGPGCPETVSVVFRLCVQQSQ